MKRVNPNHDPHHRSLGRWMRFHSPKFPHKDNDVRRYDDIKKAYGNWIERESLEDVIRKAIREERDEWRTPYWIVEAEDYRYDVPDDQKKYKKEHFTPEDKQTIREALAEDDAKYRSTSLARRHRYVRVPSLKRSGREWVNFYRTWPWIAKEVALGNERFADGAKLKYIPLFKQILDEEWPEDLKMWTDEQYEELMRKGIMKPYDQVIIKNLID